MTANKILIASIVVAGFVFRLFGLETVATCMGDQGEHFLAVSSLLGGDISLVGPPSSHLVEDKHFFFGPYSYWLPALPMAITGVNYLSYAAFMTLIQGVGVWWLWRSATTAREKVWVLALWWLNPWLIAATRNFWNPSIGLVVLFVSLGLMSNHGRMWRFVAGVLGVMAGVSHYPLYLPLILGAGWMFVREKGRGMLWWLVGGVLALSPLLLFELRNQWYNSTLIVSLLTSGRMINEGFGLPWHYFVGFITLFQFVSLRKLSLVLLPVVLVGLVSAQILLPTDRGQDMPPGLTCQVLSQVASRIASNPSDHSTNLIDLVSGDLRARYLRFLLTKEGVSIGSVDDYPRVDNLYVLVKDESFDPTSHEPWELSQVQPAVVDFEMDLGRYHLLRLTRI